MQVCGQAPGLLSPKGTNFKLRRLLADLARFVPALLAAAAAALAGMQRAPLHRSHKLCCVCCPVFALL